LGEQNKEVVSEMSNMESTVPMPKLNNENWNTWKFQIKVVLTAKDLFEYVDGTKEAPTEGAPLSTWKKADTRAQEVLVT
jgi:hypothetical protein